MKWQGHRYIHVFSFSRHCQDVFQNIHSVLREKAKTWSRSHNLSVKRGRENYRCLPDPELNKWLETIGTFEWRAKISGFSRFTFLFILTPCTLFKNTVPFNVATLCINGQEWWSHASAQDPTIETVSLRPHHKSTTMSPPGSLPELQTKYQEDISNLLLLCCRKFKHIHGQQLRYPHPTSKAATEREAEPWAFKAKEHDAGRTTSVFEPGGSQVMLGTFQRHFFEVIPPYTCLACQIGCTS